MSRNFPDGRDLNRVFPGSKNGSLASQFAYQFSTEILPHADICIDFHTGGASRYNAPQIRISKDNEVSLALAHVFNAPFLLYSKNIDKSYRATCAKKGKTVLLFEGGKSLSNDKLIAKEGVDGTMRVLKHLEMLGSDFEIETQKSTSVIIEHSHWIRAKYSGLLHLKIACGAFVKKGEQLATITDPYGTKRHIVKAADNGYIINTNEAPIVYQGDAIFHISSDKNQVND